MKPSAANTLPRASNFSHDGNSRSAWKRKRSERLRMSGERLRVLVPSGFATELTQALAAQPFAAPPAVQPLDSQSDAEVAGTLVETDALVSGSFKPAWHSERSTT